MSITARVANAADALFRSDAGSPGAPLEADLDDLHHVLSNERRRLTIAAVADHGVDTVGGLAEHIAAVENACTVEEVSTQQRKRVYCALIQGHLETLQRQGVIRWDEGRQAIRPGPTLEGYRAVMHCVQERVEEVDRA